MRQSITGEAPIHRAVLSHKIEKTFALESIIQCNANLDTLDSNGWTALIHASYHGDINSATMLIENGAKVVIIDLDQNYNQDIPSFNLDYLCYDDNNDE